MAFVSIISNVVIHYSKKLTLLFAYYSRLLVKAFATKNLHANGLNITYTIHNESLVEIVTLRIENINTTFAVILNLS